ncbi:hypothetical protein HDV00_007493 [Rhizophlyctis rosea]|nr:hypothetical protein HDV00_007493 [Rhizophlyctis rosea]
MSSISNTNSTVPNASVNAAADKPSFGEGRTEPSTLHALSERVAGNVEAAVGSLTGNKAKQTEGSARATTAFYEQEAAKGAQISRN